MQRTADLRDQDERTGSRNETEVALELEITISSRPAVAGLIRVVGKTKTLLPSPPVLFPSLIRVGRTPAY